MNAASEFDVALSFAGEDRVYVDRVALALQSSGVKVFYDLFEEADLWGKDLYTYLTDIYNKRARFTVIFISEAYGRKLWTNHERRAAQARAFQEAQEYILPARFDETEIPGVLPTIGYISLKGRSPEYLASIITKKLVSSGGTIPTELVRRDLGAAALLPATDPTQFIVNVRDEEGNSIKGASVALQADNGTTLNGKTDQDGHCCIAVKTRRIFRLMVAHPRFPAAFIDKVDPSDSVVITLPKSEDIGSVLFYRAGFVPGLKGRLNPLLDSRGRTYLYADNIAINGDKAQPAAFAINHPIELEDSDGVVVYATVKHISAGLVLIQFTRRADPTSNASA